MDALLAFGVNWKLLLIQGLNFGLLLLILYKFLYKPLFALIDKRQQVIEKGLKDAEEAGHEKEKVLKEKDAILATAREEGGKIADGIRKQATEAEKATLRGAQEKSMSLIVEARVKADAEREHILRESEKEIARMAVLATEKILRGSH
ncbi:MAG: ATP synthase F0 subunit B [Candidatus Lloydbacteria bacterium RIFCSPHIGHO2_02_FULL_54_17]|uniref:ATP synthase subunit b n=1 Tax=Candidatus Lloydbacteria bacterium RIFCSPHIGHO2_02_FULL_54_17 TaxID=1798664 RepID=A0A1G2DGE4_9BACT|nr:MAG: ATP synthase F0 subunit B [Candidatus Lloydbacteria bacterium RIFCSPHIGHO2_01_FULL_54_11]OGZ11940.1 MAG: ATP synthase F0 subunit B [Candidatus Lloydbacteria bacterium RIFCSPHIGHO2_02_FULL_54_17]OGZ14194.1 MAG: ATP synthase F0 subunit B [Candidatus Lloydbacteria bacterium RIFCSPLOWO2_01_FULL_54_18]OGZ15084.1 MAG: ATP synthase F0 subunit B [Candidatus Lloydbacteria bacterium RIFCSPLOWO2_02_FULL_54_12]